MLFVQTLEQLLINWFHSICFCQSTFKVCVFIDQIEIVYWFHLYKVNSIEISILLSHTRLNIAVLFSFSSSLIHTQYKLTVQFLFPYTYMICAKKNVRLSSDCFILFTENEWGNSRIETICVINWKNSIQLIWITNFKYFLNFFFYFVFAVFILLRNFRFIFTNISLSYT